MIKHYTTSSGHYCIIMECPDNDMDLFDYIVSRNPKIASEDEMKRVFVPVYNVLRKMYNKYKIVHGDIKCENIVINKETLEPFIIDFGYASYDNGELCKIKPVGLYPPEHATHGGYLPLNYQVWCLGNVLYDMVSGLSNDRYDKSSISRVLARCSNQLRDLLHKLLNKDPYTRMKFKDIAKHPWMVCK